MIKFVSECVSGDKFAISRPNDDTSDLYYCFLIASEFDGTKGIVGTTRDQLMEIKDNINKYLEEYEED